MDRIADFTSDRLKVSHWRADLADPATADQLKRDLIALLTPRVTAPLPPSMQLSTQDQITEWINARQSESECYLVKDLGTEALLGLLILAQVEPDTLHIGYLLNESAWGKGYATELLFALVQSCQNTAPLTLLGGVDVTNPASARVLLKAGFTLDADTSDQDTQIYHLSLP